MPPFCQRLCIFLMLHRDDDRNASAHRTEIVKTDTKHVLVRDSTGHTMGTTCVRCPSAVVERAGAAAVRAREALEIGGGTIGTHVGIGQRPRKRAPAAGRQARGQYQRRQHRRSSEHRRHCYPTSTQRCYP